MSKPLLRTVGTIADGNVGRVVTVGEWTGRLLAITPCSDQARLRIELDGGADLLTGWLPLTTPVEIHRENT